ncbi:MAG: ATP-binding cassette domain-containing protein [Candidatus Saccharimonadales bacterium]
MIKVEHLSKKYQKKLAVNDISFTVETGKVTGFLGPNGAGKSTTMRLMLGLDNGSGKTTFDGKPLHSYARPSKVVGTLLEAKAFHPTRSARNHLKVLADAGGIALARVDEALETVGLSEVAKRAPGKFSLGMSQRLGIAAAILGQPKYLILDEPANGLDPEGVAWLRKFLSDYADAGNAVFVSSHLLSEMQLMADNVVVIGKGKMIAETSMIDLIASSTGSGVFVRSPKLSVLKRVIGGRFTVESLDKGLKITGASTNEIGKIAYESNVPIYELSKLSASLEDVFLNLTEGSEEFAGQEGSKK